MRRQARAPALLMLLGLDLACGGAHEPTSSGSGGSASAVSSTGAAGSGSVTSQPATGATSSNSGGATVGTGGSNLEGTGAIPSGRGATANTGAAFATGGAPIGGRRLLGGSLTGGSSAAEGGRISPLGGTAGTGGALAGGTAGSGAAGPGSGGQQNEDGLGDLRIEANPENNLSCFVNWTTAEPADSVVQFGAGAFEWEITDPNPVTEHRVLVIGMHAAETYSIRASSSTAAGMASAEGSFTTGNLPGSIPVADVTVNDSARRQPGWTLMNIQKGDGTASARSHDPAAAVMYDEEGQPVWYFVDGTSVDRGGAVSVDRTDQGVLIGPVLDENVQNAVSPKEVDLAGNTLWECPTPNCGDNGSLTHHAGKLSNGNYVVQRDVSSGTGTAPVYEILTRDNQVVWTWDYTDYVSPTSSSFGDWCHGNSITIDLETDEVYANCRWMGLVKTTYSSKSLLWHLPAAYGAAGLGDMTFSPASSQFSDTHDPEIHDDGTILFFDNGGYSGVVGEEGNPHGYQSRAVEYAIDETTKTATLVWEFPGNFDVDPWYTSSFYLPFWGDADRLANGNVLITAGVRGTSVRSRVFEVTKQEGQVVWEFQLPPDYGVYRSERITPPLVRRIGS